MSTGRMLEEEIDRTDALQRELDEATMLLEAVQERMYRYSPYSMLKAKIDAFLEKRHPPQGERCSFCQEPAPKEHCGNFGCPYGHPAASRSQGEIK